MKLSKAQIYYGNKICCVFAFIGLLTNNNSFYSKIPRAFIIRYQLLNIDFNQPNKPFFSVTRNAFKISANSEVLK